MKANKGSPTVSGIDEVMKGLAPQRSLAELIAHQAEIIAAEESKPSPGRGVIADAEAAQRSLRDEREKLDSHDLEAIERIIATYGPLARAAYE